MSAAIRDNGDQGALEYEPLLPKQGQRRSFRSYMTAQVSRSHADFVLLVCYAVTGLLDSAATIIWGAFVSMQTGNSIYVGIGITDLSGSDRSIKSAISIASFCIGSFFFSRYHRAWGNESQRARFVLVGSYTIQVILVFAAAVIIRLSPLPEPGDRHDLHWHVLVPIALVSLQSSGQTSASRALEYSSLTTTVLTAIYCDLFSDQRLFAGITSNSNRNKRLSAPLFLLLGATVGGLWARSSFGLEGALWTAIAIKLGIVIAWLLWNEDLSTNEE